MQKPTCDAPSARPRPCGAWSAHRLGHPHLCPWPTRRAGRHLAAEPLPGLALAPQPVPPDGNSYLDPASAPDLPAPNDPLHAVRNVADCPVLPARRGADHENFAHRHPAPGTADNRVPTGVHFAVRQPVPASFAGDCPAPSGRQTDASGHHCAPSDAASTDTPDEALPSDPVSTHNARPPTPVTADPDIIRRGRVAQILMPWRGGGRRTG